MEVTETAEAVVVVEAAAVATVEVATADSEMEEIPTEVAVLEAEDATITEVVQLVVDCANPTGIWKIFAHSRKIFMLLILLLLIALPMKSNSSEDLRK